MGSESVRNATAVIRKKPALSGAQRGDDNRIGGSPQCTKSAGTEAANGRYSFSKCFRSAGHDSGSGQQGRNPGNYHESFKSRTGGYFFKNCYSNGNWRTD